MSRVPKLWKGRVLDEGLGIPLTIVLVSSSHSVLHPCIVDPTCEIQTMDFVMEATASASRYKSLQAKLYKKDITYWKQIKNRRQKRQ